MQKQAKMKHMRGLLGFMFTFFTVAFISQGILFFGAYKAANELHGSLSLPIVWGLLGGSLTLNMGIFGALVLPKISSLQDEVWQLKAKLAKRSDQG